MTMDIKNCFVIEMIATQLLMLICTFIICREIKEKK